MRAWKRSLVVMGLLGMLLGMAGCGSAPKYQVDYGGQKEIYENARDAYPAGAKVRLVYGEPATDTIYYFYVDGQEVNYEYSEKKGIVLTFTMPDHDITVRCETNNTMVSPEYDEGI